MARRSFVNEEFPALLSFFASSTSGWFMQVNDIGSNSGFPGYFDWNDHFDDDDGALILTDTSFSGFPGLTGFKAVSEDTKAFAFVSFCRAATWEGDVLDYRISVSEVAKTSRDRDVGINMELSAALAVVCLQIKTDWFAIIEALKGYQSAWTIRVVIDVPCLEASNMRDALYEISNDAACRFYDDHSSVGQFAGFEEPIFAS